MRNFINEKTKTGCYTMNPAEHMFPAHSYIFIFKHMVTASSKKNHSMWLKFKLSSEERAYLNDHINMNYL